MPSASQEPSPIAQRLRERLDQLGLTVRGASLQAGLGADTLRMILNGRSQEPSASAVNALARVLRCDVRHLLGETDLSGCHHNDDLSARIFAGLAERGHHFSGFTAERAVFHLFDLQREHIIELERREQPRLRLEVVK